MTERPLHVRAQPTLVTSASGATSGVRRRHIAALSRVATRWPAAWPFLAVATASIVAGGLVAAVSRPSKFELGPWTAAYLVLVGGVSQLVLGAGAAWLAHAAPSVGKVRAEVVAWNLGVVVTIAGTLAGEPVVTTVGGLALLMAAYWFATTPHTADTRGPRWVPVVWWATWLVIVSSVPVGVALAWSRHG